MYENRILRSIFGPKMYENGVCRRLYYAKLHSFYRSLNIVRVIKCRRLRWASDAEEDRNAFKTLKVNA